MRLHRSAALSYRQRMRLVGLVAGGLTITAAAVIVGCSRQTGSKWVGRWRRGEGLDDRSSRPRRSPRRSPSELEQAVLRARRELRLGPHPLGWMLGLPSSTVYAILSRHGCSRLHVETREPFVRYERARPGELVHVDSKKLARIVRPGHRVTGDRASEVRGAGYGALFVAVDDATRLAYAALFADESTASATAFLDQALRFYADHGITIERVLTDNGACFKRRWNERCLQLRIKPKHTRPYRPQTNGKVERLIRTLLHSWAYARTYPNEATRAHALTPYIHFYNHTRPHRALAGQTPLQRVNNLSGTYI